MQLIVSKICALILLAALRLIAGLLPLKISHKLSQWSNSSSKPERNLKRKSQIDLALSIMLCFGAGLLLATCFVHMIPEVRESFVSVGRATNRHKLEELPLAELLVCAGFFAVYFLEEIGEKFMSSAEKETVKDSTTAENPQQNQQNNSSKNQVISTISTTNLLTVDETVRNNNSNNSSSNNNHGHSHALPLGSSSSSKQQKPLVAAIRGLLIILALSFHSVFEGMAIGLQLNVKDVWFLFAAVAFHELAIIFCIGLELLTSSIRIRVYVVYMVSLALITPLGLGIGILITENSATQSPGHVLLVGVLQALAGGTLLYVTFFEVLDKERKKPENRFIKFFCVFLGFAVMAALETAGGGHDHGDGSSHDASSSSFLSGGNHTL